ALRRAGRGRARDGPRRVPEPVAALRRHRHGAVRLAGPALLDAASAHRVVRHPRHRRHARRRGRHRRPARDQRGALLPDRLDVRHRRGVPPGRARRAPAAGRAFRRRGGARVRRRLRDEPAVRLRGLRGGDRDPRRHLDARGRLRRRGARARGPAAAVRVPGEVRDRQRRGVRRARALYRGVGARRRRDLLGPGDPHRPDAQGHRGVLAPGRGERRRGALARGAAHRHPPVTVRGSDGVRGAGRHLPRCHQRLPRRPRRVRSRRAGGGKVSLLKRVFPYPLLAIALAAMWLVLNQSVAPFHVVVGLALGASLSRVMLRLDPEPPVIRRPRLILELTGVVLYDILVSNLRMIAIILRFGPRPRSGFVNIPLQLRNRYGLAALATISTSAPGTCWAAYDRRSGVLTIHVLDLREPAYWAKTVKERYERRLLEVFG